MEARLQKWGNSDGIIIKKYVKVTKFKNKQ